MQYLTQNWARAITLIVMIFIMNITILLTERAIYEIYDFHGLSLPYYQSFFLNGEFSIAIVMLFVRVLFAFFVTIPIYIGATWWFLHTVKGEKNGLKEVYICFSNIRIYLKSLLLWLSITLCKLIIAIPVVITCYITVKSLHFAYLEAGGYNGKLAVITGCSAALMVCLAFVYIFYSLGFALASYIFVSNPDISVFKCIKISQLLMKSKRMELVKLYLSFTPWIFACALVFPIFFIIPYMYMSVSVFANEIIKSENILDAA